MSGQVFSVVPRLPAQLTGTYPIIVTKSGLAYNISLAATTNAYVTRRQWFEAIAILYDMNTLYLAVVADANNPVWIDFWSITYVVPGDALSAFTQTVFGLSDAQLAAVFTLAATQPS